MDNIPGLSCRVYKTLSVRGYLRSEHYFADSCMQARIEDSVTVGCVLDKPDLYVTPITNYVCGVRVQRICEIILKKPLVAKM